MNIVTQFSEQLRKQIRTDLNNLADDLAGGGAVSYEAYRYMVGKVEGLAMAESYLIELTKVFSDE